METPLLELSAVDGGDPLLSPGCRGSTVCDVSNKWLGRSITQYHLIL